MPYGSNADLPAAADKYSDHCKSVFRRVFNDTHARTSDEGRAFATAHTAARKCQEAQKSMLDANAVDAATPKSAKFKIFSGALTPFDSGDGRKRLRTIASSSVEDLGGDMVTAQALEKMAASAKGMTIFRNHAYKVPQDILGTTEKAEVRHAGTDGNGKPIFDLVLDVVVLDSPENNKTYEAVEAGVKLGTSIGAMIPQGAARKSDNGGYVFDELRLLEASIVGIPQNPRSWVEYAASAIKLTEEDDEDTNEGYHASVDAPVTVTVGGDDNTSTTKAKVWVTVDTEETVEAEEETKAVEPEVEKGACPDCGGDAGHPKGDCGNSMHKSIEPAIESVTKEMTPSDEPAEESDEDADADTESSDTSSPESEAGEESPAQESLAESAPESADADAGMDESKTAEATLHDTVTRSAEVLADLVKTMSRERVVLHKQIEDLTHERDEARQQAKDAEQNLKVAKEIVQRIANSPLGRKAVYREAVDDFNVRLSGIYSPEILKMLENTDHVD